MNHIRNFITLSGINQYTWLNPLILGIVPFLVILWLQPVQFTPYIFNLNETSDYIIWFEDLNSDGQNEKFELRTNMANVASIFSYNEKGELIDQLNFSSKIAKPFTKRKPYALDFNNDGIKELVIFTQNRDSLFINVFDYVKKQD